MTKSYTSVESLKDTILTDKSAAPALYRVNGLPRTGRILKTPIRRFFFKLEVLKPSTSGIGNKRSRTDDHESDSGPALDSLVKTPPLSPDVATSPMTELDTPDAGHRTLESHSLGQQYTPPIPCMALQNSDHSIDAVVISTLLKLPFCCHEDLLTMSPDRIVEVAKEMNERLPEALRIDLRGSRNYIDIRREVETLVGIVKSASEMPVPGAPLKRVKGRGRSSRVVKSTFLAQLDLRAISPPTSPLAGISATRRRRRAGQSDIAMIMSPTKLAMLREEDEDEIDESGNGDMGEAQASDVGADVDEDVFRAAKKRRTSGSSIENVEMITPTMRRIQVPLLLQKLYDNDSDTSPTLDRIFKRNRSRSQRHVIFEENSLESSRNTNKVIVKTTVIDRSLANTRARYRSSSKFTRIANALPIGQVQGPLQTSTPKIPQIEYENMPLVMDVVSPIGDSYKNHCLAHAKTKSTSPTWDAGVSKIPRYRRTSDLMLVNIDGRTDLDTNKTF
ncbi:hypothetical protein AN958_03371 [Leucoagaricus sp. SymC.cos]|nr:hypothetical protein AN958_03371 [Leucoagaricus sp. SymC.cos]